MGAGCYYTNSNGSRAVWVDFGYDEEDPEDPEYYGNANADLAISLIAESLCAIGYEELTCNEFQNGLLTLDIDYTSGGDGWVIRAENRQVEHPYYQLCEGTMNRMYDRVIRALKALPYELYVATTGYTSTKIN